MEITYKAPRGNCSVCGSGEVVKADGTIRAHRQMRVGASGPYRSKDGCDGSGQPPEFVETGPAVVELEPAA